MAIRLGELAPDFTAETTEGTIKFHEWLGSGWGVLFSHPADFTPVCTTELGEVAKLKGEFLKRNVKIIALSADPLESHRKWIGDINETQKTNVNYPLIADPEFKIANLYDMVHPAVTDKFTVRSVFVIGPDKKVKLTITYPATLRLPDAILTKYCVSSIACNLPPDTALRLRSIGSMAKM
jgi:alkyl hydroperoxide reductase subunit AhpC